jgi:hypothetical protein
VVGAEQGQEEEQPFETCCQLKTGWQYQVQPTVQSGPGVVVVVVQKELAVVVVVVPVPVQCGGVWS